MTRGTHMARNNILQSPEDARLTAISGRSL